MRGKSGAALRLCQDPSAYPLDPSLLGLPAWHLAALASNRGALRYLQGCARWQVLLVYHATAAGWLLAGCWLAGSAWLAAYLQQEIRSVSCTVVQHSELYRYRSTRDLVKKRSRYGAAVGQSAAPLYVSCDSPAVPSLCTTTRSSFLRKLCEGVCEG